MGGQKPSWAAGDAVLAWNQDLHREAQMHAAIASTPKGPLFYWNIDEAVGRNGGNRFDDVLFVTWCFYKLAKWPHIPSELRDAIGKMPIRDHCSGLDGDPIVDGIKVLQRQYALMVDGRVSPVTKDATYAYGGGRSTFLILYPLNAVLAQMHPAQWPRIDLMPEFVWRIKDQATAPFIWG